MKFSIDLCGNKKVDFCGNKKVDFARRSSNSDNL